MSDWNSGWWMGCGGVSEVGAIEWVVAVGEGGAGCGEAAGYTVSKLSSRAGGLGLARAAGLRLRAGAAPDLQWLKAGGAGEG